MRDHILTRVFSPGFFSVNTAVVLIKQASQIRKHSAANNKKCKSLSGCHDNGLELTNSAMSCVTSHGARHAQCSNYFACLVPSVEKILHREKC